MVREREREEGYKRERWRERWGRREVSGESQWADVSRTKGPSPP